MRVRKKRNGEKRFSACSDILVLSGKEAFTDNCKSNKKKKLILEIGCGKGQFIIGNADRYPENNYLAMELVTDVIMLAMEKAKAREGGCPDNLRFINGNASNLTELFDAHSVDVIHLNFSDPWPKARHAKRRLTERRFLALYDRVLTDDGKLILKTDNDALFDFTLVELEESGWTVLEISRDLHNSEFNEGNIMTEYETNFSSKGKNINYLVAVHNKP